MADSNYAATELSRGRLVRAVLSGGPDDLAQACRQVDARAVLADLLALVTGQQTKAADRAFARLVRVGQQVGVFA